MMLFSLHVDIVRPSIYAALIDSFVLSLNPQVYGSSMILRGWIHQRTGDIGGDEGEGGEKERRNNHVWAVCFVELRISSETGGPFVPARLERKPRSLSPADMQYGIEHVQCAKSHKRVGLTDLLVPRVPICFKMSRKIPYSAYRCS